MYCSHKLSGRKTRNSSSVETIAFCQRLGRHARFEMGFDHTTPKTQLDSRVLVCEAYELLQVLHGKAVARGVSGVDEHEAA